MRLTHMWSTFVQLLWAWCFNDIQLLFPSHIHWFCVQTLRVNIYQNPTPTSMISKSKSLFRNYVPIYVYFSQNTLNIMDSRQAGPVSNYSVQIVGSTTSTTMCCVTLTVLHCDQLFHAYDPLVRVKSIEIISRLQPDYVLSVSCIWNMGY